MGAKQSWMTRMSRGIIFVVMLQLLTLMSNGVGASLAVSQTKLAYFDGIVSVAGFDAPDGFKHVIVAQKDGTINEVFYDDSGIYSGVLTHLDGVVGVAGFYRPDDKFKHVFAAQSNGAVTEISFNDTGIHSGTIANTGRNTSGISARLEDDGGMFIVTTSTDGLMTSYVFDSTCASCHGGIEGLPPDGIGVVPLYGAEFIASKDGTIREQSGDLITQIPSPVAIAGFSGQDGFEHAIVASGDGTVYELYYPTPPKPKPANPQPSAPAAAPKPSVTFKATPADAYVNPGASVTFNWQIANCDTGCSVSLQGVTLGPDGLSFTQSILHVKSLPSSGSYKISPKQQWSQYTLTATNAGGSASQMIQVQVYEGSQQIGSIFYFKMSNPGSSVTPCFTVAIDAKDKASAKQIAENQNGGYTATSIDASQFDSACG
jgi:hypothetical protein